MANPIKVLVVDDSAVVRQRLDQLLAADEEIDVVGHAPDPYVARDKVISLQPDVVTLDLQMPRMDGLTFLRKLMAHHPLPVVVVSSFTREGAKHSIQALEVGAVDVMPKPDFSGSREEADTFGLQLRDKVKAAARARKRPAPQAPPPAQRAARLGRTVETVVAVGASTGGTEALTRLLSRMPENAPPILIVQHMPRGFTAAFAERLNNLCAPEVLEAADGLAVRPGRVLLAPGDFHLLLRLENGRPVARVKGGPLVCRHRPSVEVLFDSVAKAAGGNAIGALLTGMGRDGAEGLLHLRQSGARTLAQDEASSVVFGMPKEAIKLGGAERVVSLDKIADVILSWVR